MTNVSPDRVARASFKIVSKLQDWQPHEQAVAAAVVFLTIAEQFGVEPQDVFVATKNLLMDEREGKREQFRALAEYVRNELDKR
jgi:hypothetical protein